MTKFIKILLYLLCIVIIISGVILSVVGMADFYKIISKSTLNLDETDISKFQDSTLINGDVKYVIDCIAVDSESNTKYYLIPLKSQNYIVLATSDTSTLGSLDNIKEQTERYLTGNIEDTTISTYVEGRLISIDDELSELLYNWDNDNNLDISITGQVIPYVIYTISWSNIKVISITGLVLIIIGVAGLFLVRFFSKKSNNVD